MEIKEVERRLSVSRSHIRFYEKEGLLVPARDENNYRNYSEADVAMLKKIILLRKLGFTVEEIARMQAGELPLPEAAADNIRRLEAEIQRLQGALDTTRALVRAQTSFDRLDENEYWARMIAAEQNGQAFADICKDSLGFGFYIFRSTWVDPVLRIFSPKSPLLYLCILLGCLWNGSFRLWTEGSFWSGFFYPLGRILVIGLCTVLAAAVLYCIRKYRPRAAEVLVSVLFCLVTLLLALAVLALLGLLVYILLAVLLGF